MYTDTTATLAIAAGDFNCGIPITGLTPLEQTGTGSHAAMIDLAIPLTAADLLPSTAQSLFAIAGGVWDPPYSVDPGPYHNPPGFVNLTGDGFLVAAGSPDESMLNTTSTPSAANHPVSDVGLNLVEPVIALTIDPVTQLDPVLGGAGQGASSSSTAPVGCRTATHSCRPTSWLPLRRATGSTFTTT